MKIIPVLHWKNEASKRLGNLLKAAQLRIFQVLFESTIIKWNNKLLNICSFLTHSFHFQILNELTENQSKNSLFLIHLLLFREISLFDRDPYIICN